MIISYIMPVKGRTKYLKKTLPTVIAAANNSPPVEFVIVNYDSPDYMDDYMQEMLRPEYNVLTNGNFWNYIKIKNKPYWHMTHSRNVGIKHSCGEYLLLTSSEIGYSPDFFSLVRKEINNGYKFIASHRLGGVVVCERKEVIDMGGFDERFEFYGVEDKDFSARLLRRGNEVKIFPLSWITSLQEQTEEERFAYYRLPLSKMKMYHINRVFYDENIKNNSLVANEGIEWGMI